MTEPSTPVPAEAPTIDVPTIHLVSGDPTAEELAALIAVVSEAYAGEAAATQAEESRRTPAWNITARGLRAPLPRGIAWGRFAG